MLSQGIFYKNYDLESEKDGKELMLHLVVLDKVYCLSFRIFGHMHGVLNVDYLRN
jgi:hypothetical protein